MNQTELLTLLREVAGGTVLPELASDRLCAGPFRQTASSFAMPDHQRRLRQGLAEVVYAEGKSTKDLLAICRSLDETGDPILVTRLSTEQASAIAGEFPLGRSNDRARTFIIRPPTVDEGDPSYIAVVAAGTSDLPVAEEAAEVCLVHTVRVARFYDVGVAGLHRLSACIEEIRGAVATVVVAGMEGALPSVVGGLLDRPVFAVPTSIGYGASFGGVAALLAMLNSCAPGVAVFNIDNGFSAGVAAARVAMLTKRGATS